MAGVSPAQSALGMVDLMWIILMACLCGRAGLARLRCFGAAVWRPCERNLEGATEDVIEGMMSEKVIDVAALGFCFK